MAKQHGTGERHWYAIHTYSGYENAVTRNLKQRIDSLNMNDKIFNVVVPTEKKIRVKGGKRVTEEERIYPGYVLVEMIVDDESWFVVRNTPRVTGFVGSGTQPVPLTEEEYNALTVLLSDAALIKFAKACPVEGAFEQDLELSIQIISSIQGLLEAQIDRS
mgnify:CR=1 FL=1